MCDIHTCIRVNIARGKQYGDPRKVLALPRINTHGGAPNESWAHTGSSRVVLKCQNWELMTWISPFPTHPLTYTTFRENSDTYYTGLVTLALVQDWFGTQKNEMHLTVLRRCVWHWLIIVDHSVCNTWWEWRLHKQEDNRKSPHPEWSGRCIKAGTGKSSRAGTW